MTFVDKLKDLIQKEPLQTLGMLECPAPEPQPEPEPEPIPPTESAEPEEDRRTTYDKHLDLLVVPWSDPALLPNEPTSYDIHRKHLVTRNEA